MHGSIGRSSDINNGNRLIKCDFIDVVNRIAFDIGDVSGGILGTEAYCAVQHEPDRRGIRFPVFTVEAVFFRNGIFAERGGDKHVAIRRSGNIRRCGRLDRRDLVDVADLELRDLGDISGGIHGTEEYRAVVGKLNRFGVRGPGSAVNHVFFHDGIFTERGGDKHVAIRRGSNIRRCSGRCRRGLVDVRDFIACNFGFVSCGVDRLEIDRGVFGERYAAVHVCGPGSCLADPVQGSEQLHIVRERRRYRDILVGRPRDVRRDIGDSRNNGVNNRRVVFRNREGKHIVVGDGEFVGKVADHNSFRADGQRTVTEQDRRVERDRIGGEQVSARNRRRCQRVGRAAGNE